jgi:hypothetical protein
MSTTKILKKISDSIPTEPYFFKAHYDPDDILNSAFAFCHQHTAAETILDVVTFTPIKYKDFRRWRKSNLKCEKCNDMTVIPFFKNWSGLSYDEEQ